MPRLRQVPLSEATENVRKFYKQLFGDRDPVAEPGTATGTPGNWWTVFALVPAIFDHATAQFGMFGMFSDRSVSKLDPKVREIALLRTGFAVGSQFVFSQHCKAGRRNGLSEEKIAAIPDWGVSDVFSPLERAVLAYTDCLVLQHGRVPDGTFNALHSLISEEDILELSYHVMAYNLHAVMCKALKLEFDDVPERIRELPVPKDGKLTADWAGAAWAKQEG
ncbi:MAG: carboxymuconolactone decarboxylase family protein [Alphaproteobacteria bacterium]|jgi:alkylhydroperoxidase family enzyme|nr:carboxymuconolactone decarboxylase family protein [Alphaproteobacteria bacterium]OJU56908.1 MAG: carboxymuconolactone decarboxylase [Alphaproteobacteria bacterium 62-8]MBN9557478.1 carboxymuconolactone decarboxylase family protein [Alphaproteobacteria bacterium]MBN9568395.1 carboxymuconolactone decarboxylase family protein [Alphaproteobacteria bacterium]MBN9577512.1 carboxymuconolactone decarboxylase family protein [Alphaproteobacteria bacterium]